MKEEVSTIKQWVDNKVATGSSSSTNTSTGTTTNTTTTNTTTTTTTPSTTNTTSTTANNSNNQTTKNKVTDKTSVKSDIPKAGISNKTFLVLAVIIGAMVILAIKYRGLKEIK